MKNKPSRQQPNEAHHPLMDKCNAEAELVGSLCRQRGMAGSKKGSKSVMQVFLEAVKRIKEL